MRLKYFANERMILLFAMSLGGLLAVFFGKELCWDLANYHYYNPYALLHHRTSIDYWPSSFIHQYLNPTIDLLNYYLINTFTPMTTEFLLGAIHGINLWLTFLIARLFTTGNYKNAIAFAITLFGLYGPVVLPSMGSFQNDNIASIFILGSIFLILKFLQTDLSFNKTHLFLISISGVLLGAGIGLKLTGTIFGIGSLGALCILPLTIRHRLYIVSIMSITIGLGLCLTSGYWMFLMWQQHHNPLFPFLNNIFHSSDFVANNWRDTRFLPQGLSQQLFFPFYFSWDGRTSDVNFFDFRFMVCYLLFAAAGIKWLLRKSICLTHEIISLKEIWLFSFFIFSYIAWQSYFSIARYLLSLEILSPLIIYLLLKLFIKNWQTHYKITLFTLGILSLLMKPVPFVRSTNYQGSFFNPHIPISLEKIPHAVVLMAYPAFALTADPRPQSYLIPYFPKEWQFVGMPFINQQYLDAAADRVKIQSMLTKTSGDIYLLTTKRNILNLYQAAMSFGLNPNGPCLMITSDRQHIAHQMVVLCPVKLISEAKSV